MRGTLRYRAGAWRLQVFAGKDPATGKDRRVTRTVKAPESKAGRKVAEAALAKLVVEVEAGRHQAGDTLTVEQLLERWFVARSRDWSPGHVYQTRRVIDARIVPRIGRLRVDRLRPLDLDALYNELRERGGENGTPLAAGTVQKVHVTLHAALEQAVRWQVIPTNPAAHATAPGSKETEVAPPEPEDVGRVIRALLADEPDPRKRASSEQLFAFLALAASTGARRGSLCALRWGDLDLEAGTVTFARSIVDGGPGVGLVVKGTKTDKPYTAALDGDTVAILERHRKRHVETCLAAGLPADGFVFTREGSLPWRPDTASKRWLNLRREHGLDDVRFHDLRHMVVTQLLADGEDAITVAGRVGHASPNMIHRRYGHFRPEKDRVAAEKMGAKLRLTGSTEP